MTIEMTPQNKPRAAAEAVALDIAAERDAVRAFALRLTGNPGLADDLAQEASLRAHRKRKGFRGEASVRSWLFTITLNLVRDHARSATRHGEGAGEPDQHAALTDDPEDAAMKSEMDACIAEFVLALPGDQRDAVALHDIAGLSHREIAGALGVSQNNARVLLHRGRAKLKERLADNCRLAFEDDVPCERK